MSSSKSFTAEIKAFGDESLGQVDFYASVYNNLDKYGDIMWWKSDSENAFAETLANDYRAKNKRLPVTFAHAMGGGMIPGSDPYAFVGYAEAQDVTSDEHGLRVKAQLNMDSDYARTVYGLVKDGLIDQASFTFSVQDEKKQKDGSRLIKKVKLYEAALTMVGVNDATTVNAIKALTDMEEQFKVESEEEERAIARAKTLRDIELAAYRMRLHRS